MNKMQFCGVHPVARLPVLVFLVSWGMAGHPTPPMQIIKGMLSFLLKIFYFIFFIFSCKFPFISCKRLRFRV